MALEACFYCSSRQNSSTIPANDDPIHALLGAFTKSKGFFIPTFWTSLPIPSLFSAFIALSANEDLFKQFI